VGGLLLLHWCWGLLEQACNIQRINYVYLLDLNPKSVSSPRWVQHSLSRKQNAHLPLIVPEGRCATYFQYVRWCAGGSSMKQ
jgi:hypothetical protein